MACSQREPAWFSEEARERGLDFDHHSGFDGRSMMPEMMGGGVALAHLDGDRDTDLCFVKAYHVTSCGPTAYGVPAMDRLYRNNGDGHSPTSRRPHVSEQRRRTVTDVTKAAGIDVAFGNGLGNVAADFNGDGL